MDERFHGATGEGLLGTGTLLLGGRATGPDTCEAEAWWALLFVPLVPRGAWTLVGAAQDLFDLRWEPRSFELVRRDRRPLEPRRVLARWGRVLAILVATLAPAAWTFLRIEQTGVLPAIRLVAAALLPLYVVARLDYALVRVRRARPSRS